MTHTPRSGGRSGSVGNPSTDERPQIGRIAFRVEGDWWVAYYAMPDTMADALELARIQMAIVADHPWRKDTFMKLIQHYVKEIIPAFEIAEQQMAPANERAGRA